MNTQHGQRILAIEDDEGLQRVLARLLERDGFDVTTTGEGRAALALLSTVQPDLVVMDLGLPDVNGFDLLREVRSTTGAPIIVLSGRSDEADRVLALETGADDYVVKPFLNREFVARVRVRLRRSLSGERATGDHPSILRDRDLSIDLAAREVRLADELLSLTAKEFDLLCHLASAPRQVFSRSQLLEGVWQSSAEWQGESTVTEHVHRLRQKVGSERIATVRGVGYRFDPADARLS